MKFKYSIKIIFSIQCYLLSLISMAQEYTLTDKDVTVKNGIITDCSYKFDIKDIIIPEKLDGQTIVEIGSRYNGYYNGIFAHKGITSVKLPNTLIKIGQNAFYNNNISKIIIPKNTTSIGDYSFSHNKIQEISLSEKLEDIGSFAFSNNNISSLDFSNNIISLGKYCFSDNSLNNVSLPNSIKHVGAGAFVNNKITSVIISNSITVLPESIFAKNKIVELIIPDNIIEIGHNAFGYNNLSKVILSKNINSIGTNAFSKNENLRSINIPEKNSSEDNYLYWANGLGEIFYPGESFNNFFTNYNKVQDYTIKDTDVNFKNGSIEGVIMGGKKIKSIIIPEKLKGQTVTGIESNSFGVFYDRNIISITFPKTIKKIGDLAFFKNIIKNLDIPNSVETIGRSAFCSNQITEIKISDNITFIGNTAFAENKIKSLILPKSLKSIQEITFYKNEISYLKLPSEILRIEDRAFAKNNISDLHLPRSLKVIGSSAFESNSISEVIIPKNIKKISHSSFRNNLISNLIISDGVEEIGEFAFNNNQLTEVNIPNSVIKIGNNAFSKNINLKRIKLPTPKLDEKIDFIEWIDSKGRTYKGGAYITDYTVSYNAIFEYTLTDNDVIVKNGIIESCSYNFFAKDINIPTILDNQIIKGIADKEYKYEGVFYNKGIRNVNLPNSIEFIGSYSFSKNKIINLNIPKKTTYIKKGAFSENKLKQLVIPNNIILLGERAFQDNQISYLELSTKLVKIPSLCFSQNKLKNVVIPNGIKYIYRSAFNSNEITNIKIPESIQVIEGSAFSNNYNLKGIKLPNNSKDNEKIFSFWMYGEKNAYNGGEFIHFENSQFSIKAIFEYKLKDDDVIVKNGIIKSINRNLKIHSLIIPEILDNQYITGIESNNYYCGVFQNMSIWKLKLPKTIKKIGHNSFADNKIDSIQIPKQTKTIEYEAFYRNRLKYVIISDSVIFVGRNAFNDNIITNIKLPKTNHNGVKFINWIDNNDKLYKPNTYVYNLENSYSAIFQYILKDKDVVVNNGIIEHCYYDFFAKDIIIPEILDNQKIIGIAKKTEYDGVFSTKKIINIQIPNSIETIGDYSFKDNNIKHIELPNSISHIGRHAFSLNKLKDITLPYSHKEGFEFKHWTDSKGNIYDGLSNISDYSTTYKAVFNDPKTDITTDDSWSFTVSPNPVSNIISIIINHYDKVLELEVISATGKSLYKKGSIETNNVSIDFSGFNNSILFIKITYKNGTTAIKKIIKI